jgi:hypothetical protein
MRILPYVTPDQGRRSARWSIVNRLQTLAVATWNAEPGAHMEAQATRTKLDDDVRLCIEAALARRHDKFALSYLSWTADGYIVKFRLGVVDVVRTAVGPHVVEDSSRMDKMLDCVGLTFRSCWLL